ncbi:MAG: TIGR03960 family B12-binding radical SAM protein [Calditrichaceae bacterium]
MKNNKLENILVNKILPFVSKPGRYIGNELNVIPKGGQQTEVSAALAFPEIYEIGMSYIGFEILYHVLNMNKHIAAERVFLPWIDMQDKMENEGVPLYSLETFTPLKEFDLIGFTLQYELTYTNVLQMLYLGHIPVFSGERTDNDPIILGGGPCAGNPEPMSDFIDAYLIGDGETAFIEICNTVAGLKKSKASRIEKLKSLAKIDGVYVPSLYDVYYDDSDKFKAIKSKDQSASLPVITRIEPELRQEFYPFEPIVPILEVTHDRLALEVMRGCTEGCRYCSAGMIYRPVRERSPEDIVKQSKAGIESSGYDEVSFLSLSISDYSQLSELMAAEKASLQDKYVNVSLPSMRLDNFNEDIARFVSSVRKSGFTFAPEAGSERLRKVINKNIKDSDIFNALETALGYGWKQIKFYFMIGLPTETKEDIHAIADLIERVSVKSKSYGYIRFNISISPFSPKAHTPFQWEAQDTREILIEKVNILRTRLRRLKNVNLNWRNPDISTLECVLGRGDRRMGKAIHYAWKHGAQLDGWMEHFNFDTWKNAINDAGISIDDLRDKFDKSAALPWDHIDKGVSKSFLLRENTKAYNNESTLDCSDDVCHVCGIQRKSIFGHLTECRKNNINKHPENDKPEIIEDENTVNKELRPVKNQKFRMCYTKTGYARFISHLDLIRVFERTCRRAEIPVAYSEGFNPRPKFSFAPPLSLGYSSESEYMDVEIKQGFSGELKEKLNAHLPEGIFINNIKEISGSIESLNEAIKYADYEIQIQDRPLDGMEFKKDLKSFLEKDEIIVQRRVKGKIKSINIRPFISSINHKKDTLHISTKSVDRRTVRINEILECLFTDGGSLISSVHRKRQIVNLNGEKLSPLDVV